MSQTGAETAVLQAIHGDGALTPYGLMRVQMQGTTAYVAVPIELTKHFGIERGYDVQRAYDVRRDVSSTACGPVWISLGSNSVN